MGKKMPATIINLDGVSIFPRWYTVVTKYNYEAKLGETIINGAEKAGMGDKIFEVLVPIKTTIETKVNVKGKVTERKKHEKIYPLYIFVKAIMNADVWNYIKNSEGSSAILAPSGFPIQVEEEDILKIKEQCGLIEHEPSDVELEVGYDVYVRSGALQGQYGKVSQIKGNTITVDINGIKVQIDVGLLEYVVFAD